jgi:hypothetical protein
LCLYHVVLLFIIVAVLCILMRSRLWFFIGAVGGSGAEST